MFSGQNFINLEKYNYHFHFPKKSFDVKIPNYSSKITLASFNQDQVISLYATPSLFVPHSTNLITNHHSCSRFCRISCWWELGDAPPSLPLTLLMCSSSCRHPAVMTQRSQMKWSWSALHSWALADPLFMPEAGETGQTDQGTQTEERTTVFLLSQHPPFKLASHLTPFHLRWSQAPPSACLHFLSGHFPAHCPLTPERAFHRPAHSRRSGYSPET